MIVADTTAQAAPALDPSGVSTPRGRYPRGSNRGDSVGIVWAAVSLHDYRRVTRRVPARIALRPLCLSPGPGAIARGLRGVRLMVASLIIPTAARRPSSDRVSAQGNALEEFRNYPHNANSHAVEMLRELFFILASFLLSESAALQISVSTPVGWSSTQATATKIRMREPSPDERKAAKDALEAANAKLEALNAIGQAPKSWADLGTPQKLDREIEVPGFLNWLPGVIGTLSVITLLLNNAGVFGNGPSIDELNRMAEDFSNSVS